MIGEYRNRISHYLGAQTRYFDTRRGTVRLDYNTWVDEYPNVTDLKAYAIIFHRTPIVIFWEDGVITLNTGGFNTYTTKKRMNDYSPFHIWQRDWSWYASLGEGPYPMDRITGEWKFDEISDGVGTKKLIYDPKTGKPNEEVGIKQDRPPTGE